MSTVFILQEPQPRPLTGWVPDTRPAKTFGEIVYVFTKCEKPHALPREVVEGRIKTAMKDFQPANDYILWCGGDIITLILCIAHLTTNFGSMKLLQWQRNRKGNPSMPAAGFYAPTAIDFTNV